MRSVKDINLNKVNSSSFAYKVIIDHKRLENLKICLICNQNHIFDKINKICKNCHEELIKNFPEKYFPQSTAFQVFCEIFDTAYKDYEKSKGYIIIKIPLRFKSEFTVIDVEATGDIHKDKKHFVITMGYLSDSEAQIYQLIDFKKKREFLKKCKNVGYKLPRPLVAYNYQSELIWLKLFTYGWIEILRNEIVLSKNGKASARSVKLDDICFKWDDINGKQVIEESELYLKTQDLIHIKKIAYHNFIDLLKEYLIGITNIKVNDYLKGKIWDYRTNNLHECHTCRKCYRDFYTKRELFDHLKDFHKMRFKKKQ